MIKGGVNNAALPGQGTAGNRIFADTAVAIRGLFPSRNAGERKPSEGGRACTTTISGCCRPVPAQVVVPIGSTVLVYGLYRLCFLPLRSALISQAVPCAFAHRPRQIPQHP